MKNILLKIEYKGTKYYGWQRQRRGADGKCNTVQGIIEAVLAQILQEKVCLTASGRTDAGVHAREQCANFRTLSNMPGVKIKNSLNALLPEDIRIKSVHRQADDFHSRFQVKDKVYRYTILNRSYNSAFLHDVVCFVRLPMDVKAMRRAAGFLTGRHDFKSFQARDKRERSSVRNLKKIIIRKRGALIEMDFQADGFIYNMVRNLSGTLIAVGLGKISPEGVRDILMARDRSRASPTAPAKGLSLLKVYY